jgi:hypothetical protein
VWLCVCVAVCVAVCGCVCVWLCVAVCERVCVKNSFGSSDVDGPPAPRAMPRPSPTPLRAWAVVRRWWVVDIYRFDTYGVERYTPLSGWHHQFEHAAELELADHQSGAHARAPRLCRIRVAWF